MEHYSTARSTGSRYGISEAEVVSLCNGLIEVMKRLELLLADETDRVRNHAYDALEAIHSDKARLSKAYIDLMAVLREHLDAVKDYAPDMIENIRARHDMLQIIIRDNLTAIGAAKAVSESLLNTIADEVQKQRQPVTAYTAQGSTQVSRRHNPALAINERF